MVKIGFITTKEDVINKYFPNPVEPFFVPKEPNFTPDDQIAVDYLRQKFGCEVSPVIWGTPAWELSLYDLLVVRSPWDYMDSDESIQSFFQWIDSLDNEGIKVFNPPELMRWLLDKHYLRNFEQAGIPIVPTEYANPGEFIDLVKIHQQKGPFIIKPCISAAGEGLRFIQNEDDAKFNQTAINEESHTGSFMIQDFIKEIKTNGEWSLIYFGNKYSHAVHKIPGAENIYVHAERGGSLKFEDPDDRLIEFGDKVIKALKQAFEIGTNRTYQDDALYLRIDVIETSSGYLLSECEGVEPELFFRAKPGSEALFAEDLLKRVNKLVDLSNN